MLAESRTRMVKVGRIEARLTVSSISRHEQVEASWVKHRQGTRHEARCGHPVSLVGQGLGNEVAYGHARTKTTRVGLLGGLGKSEKEESREVLGILKRLGHAGSCSHARTRLAIGRVLEGLGEGNAD
ncbi:zinc finger and BTB domain-containing protein 1 [Striga asiatica]|uniref:Zinc finger and BTB domain-containing protein 1 n=1 Tax=Striga asiatica TaxID=4170 RepID=A0A5A7Q306_STRAF|nr:zinc finger and BTB domain-containing protein 1 [Striga asiatica]